MERCKYYKVENHKLGSQRQTAEHCGVQCADSPEQPAVRDFHQGQYAAQHSSYYDSTERNEQGYTQALENQDIALPRYHCVINGLKHLFSDYDDLLRSIVWN